MEAKSSHACIYFCSHLKIKLIISLSRDKDTCSLVIGYFIYHIEKTRGRFPEVMRQLIEKIFVFSRSQDN